MKAVPEREGGRRKPDGRVLTNDKFIFNVEKAWFKSLFLGGEDVTQVTDEGKTI